MKVIYIKSAENVPELFCYIFNNFPDVLILMKQQRIGICGWKFGFIGSLAFVLGVVVLDSHIGKYSKLTQLVSFISCYYFNTSLSYSCFGLKQILILRTIFWTLQHVFALYFSFIRNIHRIILCGESLLQLQL
jgi:formate-dependent nitrite reductase membrane component NrfD